MDKLVAFIPARGGSKSIPLKNVKTLLGKPLVHYVVEAALNCSSIQKVYVSTDSDIIKQSLLPFLTDKLIVIDRSPQTATDIATTESALLEFAHSFNFQSVILIQPTSPLLSTNDLKGGIDKYLNCGCNSLLSVVRQKRFFWGKKGDFIEPLNYSLENRPRRQEFDGQLIENGAFYITNKKSLLESKIRISGAISYYKMPEESYYELDEISDWIIVESIIKSKTLTNTINSTKNKLKPIKLVASDVDGVLTDSGMYYDQLTNELKKFSTRDGKGFELLRNNGLKTAIITSEDTPIVKRRAEKLKIDHLYMGIIDKASIIKQLADKENIDLEQIAYIGDDINDHEVLKIVGFSACPNDAIEQNKAIVDYVCKKKGGEGCLRELCDLILNSYE